MSQPTGEHADGVKLATAYVEVGGKTAPLGNDIKTTLTGVEQHAQTVGENSAKNIVQAVTDAGEPASKGFIAKLQAHMLPNSKLTAEQAAMGFGATFKDALGHTDIGSSADFLFNGFKDKAELGGAAAANSFHGRLIQMFAANRAGVTAEAEKTGNAMADGIVTAQQRVAQAQADLAASERKSQDVVRITNELNAQGITYSEALAQAHKRTGTSENDLIESHSKLSLAQQALNDASMAQGNVVASLVPKHEALAEAQDKVKTSAHGMADAHHASAKAAAENLGLAEAFHKASGDVSQLGANFGEAGEQAGALGGKLSSLVAPLAMFANPEVLGVGAVLGIVGALGLVVDKVNALGEKWEELGHQIEIQTGATGERLEALKGQVGDVYSGVTNSMGEVADTVSAVNTIFKDTGQGAADVSKQIENLSAMTGKVNVDTLGQAFKGFNIGGDAAQQQSVIDGLLKTAQDTRTPVNELISSMQRIAPTMDAAHISMKDTLAMFDQFGQAGIKPEQTFYLMNKAAADATKQGKDFHTVLTDTITAIKNAPTEAEAERIAKPVFGGASARGGNTVAVQAIRSGNVNLDPEALAQLEQWDGLVNKTRADTLTWHDQWTIFGHGVANSLRPISEELHENVQGAMNNVITWLSAHKGDITSFAGTIVSGFEKGATAIGHLVQEALPSIHAAIDYLKPEFEAMEPSLRKLGAAIGPAFVAIGRDAVPVVKALGEAIIWALGEGMKYAPPFIDATTHIVNAVKDVADWLHKAFGPALASDLKNNSDDFNTMKQYVEDIVNAVKKVDEEFHKVEPTIAKFVDDGKRGFDEVVKGAEKIQGVFDKIGSKIADIVRDINNIHIPDIHMPDLNPLTPPVHHGQTGLALPGYGGGDIVPAMLEPGEHVFTKEDVTAAGGHGNIMLLRSLLQHGLMQDILGFNGGGMVPTAGGSWTDEGTDIPGFDGHRAYGYNPDGTTHIPFPLQQDSEHANGPHYNRDRGSAILLGPQGLKDLGGVLGSGSEGNTGANFGLWPFMGPGTLGARWGGPIGFDTGGPVPGGGSAPPGWKWDDRMHVWRDPRGFTSPTLPTPQPGILVGARKPEGKEKEPKSKPELASQAGDWADRGEKAHKYAQWGTDALEGSEQFGGVAEQVGGALEFAEPFSKALGGFALPFALLGGVNWGANMLGHTGLFGGRTNLSPAERLQQMYYYSTRNDMAKHPLGSQWGGGDVPAWRPGYKGETPQGIHIPLGPFANLLPKGTNLQVWGQPGHALIPSAMPPASGTAGSVLPGGPGTVKRPGQIATQGDGSGFPPGMIIPKPGGIPDIAPTDVGGHRLGGAIQRFAKGGAVRPLSFASGGRVSPASGSKRESGWVIDRYNLAKPKPLHFAGGGAVGGYGGLDDVKAMLAAQSGRTPYVWGGYSPAGVDCSGLVAEAVELYLGEPMSGGHPMSTGNEASWLSAHGFKQGTGPEGSFRVGFYNGGPGGGHTALTLPDGTNAESGGSGGGVRLGGGAAGANNSEFTDHWYLPPREVISPAGFGSSRSGGGGTGGGSSGGYGGAGGADGAVSGAGGGGGGGFAAPTVEQQTKYNDELVASQDRITAATNRVNEAQAKLDADRANPKKKPEDIAKDEDHLAEAKSKVAEAQSKYNELQEKPPQGKQEKGEKGGKDGFTGLFGDTLMKMFGANLPEGFSNPLEWGGVKSASALFKFFGAALGGSGSEAAESLVGGGGSGGGGYGAGGGGGVSPYVQGLIAQVPGASGKVANDGGGQSVHVTHQANYYGDINDHPQHRQAQLAADKRTTNKTLGRWVMT